MSLLNVFDNGILAVASGERTYSFRSAIIFMTSNLGAERLRAEAAGAARLWRRMVPRTPAARKARLEEIAQSALLAKFPPEFVNRIDHVEVFNWIEPDVVHQIIGLELEKLNRRLAKHQCQLEADEPVFAFIARKGFDRQFGARSLRRAVRQLVEVPFAGYLVDHFSHHPAGGIRKFRLMLDRDSVGFLETGTG